MKKIIMIALVLSTLTISSFANAITGINEKAQTSFSKSFRHAADVRWEVKDNLYKVTFTTGGKVMFAYYNVDGDQVALSRNLHIEQLPLSLSTDLTSKFENSWITGLFEVSVNNETTYYATLESATHTITLKANGTSGWTTFKKEKKK